jgi:hypothetical protein
MYPDQGQLAISRVLDAPRELAFRAFTDPDHLATWWWLPAHLAGPSNQGCLEALEKLDATLLHVQAVAIDAEV